MKIKPWEVSDAKLIPCPYCGAGKREACRTRTGRPHYYHHVRVRLGMNERQDVSVLDKSGYIDWERLFAQGGCAQT